MKRLTTKEYIKRAKEAHGDTYNYDKTVYVNSKTKVTITCPIHGDWKTTPTNHISKLNKCGCPKCAGRGLSTEEWVEKFRNVHGDKFDYSKFTYNSIHEKSTIICLIHGDFKQNPHNHAQGQQCPECSKKEAWVHNSYYNVTNAEKNKIEWLTIPCTLYVIKMTFENEEFYKIGITNQPITRRFRKHDIPYTIEVVKAVESNRYDAILLENKLHILHKDCTYTPKQLFKGYTECFTTFKGIPND